ncbi:protein polyglycylase TTLL10 isoform X2 [Stigmatopora nigra]
MCGGGSIIERAGKWNKLTFCRFHSPCEGLSASSCSSAGEQMSSESLPEPLSKARNDGSKEDNQTLLPLPPVCDATRVGTQEVKPMKVQAKEENKKRRARGSGGKRGKRVEEPQSSGPFFYFGGGNGAEIVSAYCEKKGWTRTYNKHREDFKLKWCEIKSSRTYLNFREGQQLVYQIPNNKVLTTKIGLLNSLREYERVSSKVNHGRAIRNLKMKEFIPTTFRLDVKEEREAFFARQQGGKSNYTDMWICKPTGLNQGRGIFLLRTAEDVAALKLKLQRKCELQNDTKVFHRQPQAYVVQHYIQKPLLLKEKKFDVRSYLLIACTSPYMVFFRHGYVRLTCDPYDPDSRNLSAHLTNQCMQRKNPLYSRVKEDTVWTMESFNAYVNERFSIARDWVLGAFTRCMRQIMTQCFLAVKSKLDRKLGFFDLIGCDFMVDQNFKVWLLEMNCNPALHVNCEVLKKVIPNTIAETLGKFI